MSKKHQLASLQLAIMQVLWERGEATVADVRDALENARPLAYTTIATMLSKMEGNGQVTHRTERRVNVYRPALRQDDVSKSMVSDLVTRLFHGDVAQMVSHLLDDRDIGEEELGRLKELLRQKEKEATNGE